MTYLVHIPLPSRDFGRWSASHRFLSNEAAMHFLITGLFGRQEVQPFRFFEGQDDCSIYGYSDKSEVELRDLMRLTATPDMPVDPDNLRSKLMPVLSAGQRIGFDLRISPVRRKGSIERDAHDADIAAGSDRDRSESYLKWLSEKMVGSAEIESFRLWKYRRFEAHGISGKRSSKYTVPDATIHGTVIVSDPIAFQRLLSSGIGRRKSYGFGMLLLRPADPVEI